MKETKKQKKKNGNMTQDIHIKSTYVLNECELHSKDILFLKLCIISNQHAGFIVAKNSELI
jgi:hypothetical protein